MNNDYEKLSKLAVGSYGNVYKCRSKKTGHINVIKYIPFDKLYSSEIQRSKNFDEIYINELEILKITKHKNIIEMLSYSVDYANYKLCIVFEYIPFTLEYNIKNEELNNYPIRYKNFMIQLLKGVEYLHENKIIHRDLKPTNILIDLNDNLKIIDMGMSIIKKEDKKMESETQTLWYRSPELLLGEKNYSYSIDIWSLGCIFMELIDGFPYITGKTEVNQLHEIFKVFGTPNENIWEKFPYMPNYENNFPDYKSNNNVNEDILKMFCYNPLKRITATEMLKCKYLE